MGETRDALLPKLLAQRESGISPTAARPQNPRETRGHARGRAASTCFLSSQRDIHGVYQNLDTRHYV